ncbi:LacI family DNA-binding transcriptional regulator [Asanoa sp. WMMD1127]|uniref:LacI family DNA-binding transcriptional regulator n=1 Tax=Asanoa sp. WMMD1127 TaxID=3016107 RepID=UPI002417F2C0|nr:LacI family DNA-binding transcriptional regulator [Asanoa sp. WMMD1127]MDG4823660.1 LacI family DNA-binding transcriptional regulator [Asanoa sp. WMMD1127]
MPEKVTIATVAAHAQVSRQTVSNVLNSPHIVRDETRRRVEEAIATLGYRANQAARQMRTGRSQLLAVRIEPTRDGINGSVLDRFLHGLTFAAAAAGYRVMLYTADDHADEIKTFDNLLASYDLDGFVLTGTDHGDVRTLWLAERDVPFVTFGRPWDEPERHSWVDVDNAHGTAQATRRLIETGHRRIAFVGWPAGSGVGDDRRDGWQRTMKAYELDPAGLDRGAADGIAQGAECARDLLALPNPPTAFVCASDSLALGALQAGGGHPAVTGFDDTPVAQAIGLTSVSQPLPEAAARCIDLLTDHLDGRPSGTTQVLLQPSLVVRTTA